MDIMRLWVEMLARHGFRSEQHKGLKTSPSINAGPMNRDSFDGESWPSESYKCFAGKTAKVAAEFLLGEEKLLGNRLKTFESLILERSQINSVTRTYRDGLQWDIFLKNDKIQKKLETQSSSFDWVWFFKGASPSYPIKLTQYLS